MWKSNNPEWKSLEPKKKIFRTSIFAVCSEKFQCLRTGAQLDFITLSSWNWVNVIARTEAGKILLIRQFRPGTMQQEIEIPGGCIDPADPSPEAAGARELLEETGYAGDPPEIIGKVSPNPAIQGNFCYTVLIDNAKQISAPQLEDTESIETAEVTEETLREMIFSGKIRHGLVLNAIFFYLSRRKK
jgi:8-oxo-dGTP pyrophosphatase MutT (NUDIX family)